MDKTIKEIANRLVEQDGYPNSGISICFSTQNYVRFLIMTPEDIDIIYLWYGNRGEKQFFKNNKKEYITVVED